jgi:hypothetical protein
MSLLQQHLWAHLFCILACAPARMVLQYCMAMWLGGSHKYPSDRWGSVWEWMAGKSRLDERLK